MADHNHHELINLRRVVVKLAGEIDYKNHLLMEKEGLSLERFATMSSLIEEKDRLLGEKSAVIGSLMAQTHRLNQVFVEEKRKCEDLKQETKSIRHELENQQQKLDFGTMDQLQHFKAQNEDLQGHLENLKKKFSEKEEALLQLESLNKTLISNEHSSSEELKAGKAEAIKFFLTMDGTGAKVGIKRIGEIDPQPFRDVCSKKLCSGNWEEKSKELYSLWQKNVNDPSWNPFQKETKNGELNEVVDENDKKLKKLREECGEEAFKAVVNALQDLKKYSARSSIPELWNFEEGRRAYLKEVIQYMIQKWEFHRNKDTEQSQAIIELRDEKQKLLQKLSSSNILMEEKDKLLKEKYAVVGRLMVQDAEKDKLLGQMSATISTLTAEKNVLLESCNAEKKTVQYLKEQIAKLKHESHSQEELAKQREEPKETKKNFCRDDQTMAVKEEGMEWRLNSLIEQVAGSNVEKQKNSIYHNTKDQSSSTSENKKFQGQNTGEVLKVPKVEPDLLGESLDEDVAEASQPSTNPNLMSSKGKAVTSSPLQYSIFLESFFQTTTVKREEE